jgi:ATP-binding cassette subfamily F protein 3
MLLQVQGLGRQIGGRWLFRNASLSVQAGDRIGLVGPNGAGKSTLLRTIATDESPDEGQVQRSRDMRLGMLRQEIDPTLSHTVQQEAARALERLDALEREMRELEESMADSGERGEAISTATAERYDQISGEFAHGDGFGREARVASVLAGLGFDDEARERPLSSFSGGWLMRVELAKLFLARPDVMLLDEPTNHLDLPAIQWFEEALASFPGALVIVSHDRTFLRKHATRFMELDGLGGAIVYEGRYDRYLALREERREQQLARKANQDREIAQMERFVERFRAKSTKAKQAQSRVKALEKIERIEVDADAKRRMRLRIPAPPRSGEQVIRLEDIHKSYGEKSVYRGMEFAVRRGERVALAGPNGAGKSTLLRIVSGTLDFDEGKRTLGHNVQAAYFAQHQLEALDPDLSVLEELSRSARNEDMPRLRGHLGAFLFSGDDVEKKISVLSGGEKSRVALAKMLLRPANLLVLDEPTNHLDIPACEVLEEALASYEGTLVFVSHDRAFINALASRVVEVKYGELRDFSGNYDDYLYRVERLDSKADDDTKVPADDGTPSHTEVEANAPAPANPSPPTEPSTKPSTKPRPKLQLSKEERQQERERRKNRDRVTRRIGRVEGEIQEREQALEQLSWQLGDPAVSSDADRLSEVHAEQQALQTAIDDLYAEWERLSDEAAALEDLLN